MRFAAAPGPPDTPGTLTKFYRVAEDFVYKISASMGLAEAVMVEPLAVAVHAVKLGDVRPGETVVVMGSGTVGLLCAAVARQFGAHRVISVDILPKKLEFAREYLGCETYQFSTAGSAEDNAAALLKQFDLEEDGTDTFGGRVDTVIEASGAGSSIETGIHILRPGGKFVQTGVGKAKVEFPILAMGQKDIAGARLFQVRSWGLRIGCWATEEGIVGYEEANQLCHEI
jgi:D-xylulose reductase